MKILILGYGKMGKAIETIALNSGHEVIGKITSKTNTNIPTSADVAIEFSNPESAVANIMFCIDHKIPVVSGTTGWLSHKKDIDLYCTQKNGTFFYASNYSIGVNIFFKVNQFLAEKMKSQGSYDVEISEIHHTQKKDSPSGTAITLAETITGILPFKKEWSNIETHDPSALVIKSKRIDPTPGTHTVKYTSATDDIDITHTAHSREGFAKGAVLVAEWIRNKKGVLSMDDFLNF
ncbi:MAG: 4-hydroxy-tetrahydrodipicolinate reductase [Flammeovirgaceae bacterium]|nr:4-hydroxy-tetrahydrodipicolinate reductase [Flammeovirgaceae bacterium]